MKVDRVSLFGLACVLLLIFGLGIYPSTDHPRAITYGGEATAPTKTGRAVENGWGMVHVYSGTFADEGDFAKQTPPRDDSQVGQASTIALLMDHKPGYFLDLAANDALSISNTVMLDRDLGWDGLCVEANPMYWEKLSQRKCTVVGAAVGSQNNEEVVFNYDGVFGGIVGDKYDNREVKKGHAKRTVMLKSLLDKFHVPRTIDFWSFDVEGAEEYIASVFPWSEYSVQILTVERPNTALKQILFTNGMRYVCDHGYFGDQMWVIESRWDEFKSKIVKAHTDKTLPTRPPNHGKIPLTAYSDNAWGLRINQCLKLTKTHMPPSE